MRRTTILLLGLILVVCTVVFADGAAPVNWKRLPTAVRDAKKVYDREAASIQAEYDEAVAAAEKKRQEALADAQAPLLAAIDAAIDTAAARGKDDQVEALTDAKESLEGEQTVEEKIIGTWHVEWTGGARG